MPTPKNRLRCRYCRWETLRFRGRRRGERALRLHVIETHFEAYQRTMGYEKLGRDTPWMLDEDTR